MNELTLRDGLGGRIPNPAAFGISCKPVQKLAEECDDLADKGRKTGLEWQAAKERVKDLEDAHYRARILAHRGGPEPSEAEAVLQAARTEMGALEQAGRDLRQAAILARDDLTREVAKRPEIRARLSDAVNREAEQVAALERDLAVKRHALETKMAADRWLENPEASFGVAPGPVQGVAA